MDLDNKKIIEDGERKSDLDGMDNFLSVAAADSDSNTIIDDGFDSLLLNINEESMKPAGSSTTVSAKPSSSSFFTNQSVEGTSEQVKRCFEGPAGILPVLTASEMEVLETAPAPLICTTLGTRKRKLLESKPERNVSTLSKTPWKKLLHMLELDLKDENCLLHHVNIKWIHKLIRRSNTLHVPLLVAVVRDYVKGCSNYQNYELFDNSGKIMVTPTSSFAKSFAEMIQPGTALALQNCGINKYGNQRFVTVSAKNLLCLSTEKMRTDLVVKNKPDADECNPLDKGLLIIQMAELDKKKVFQIYERLKMEMEPISASVVGRDLNLQGSSSKSHDVSSVCFGDFPDDDDDDDFK